MVRGLTASVVGSAQARAGPAAALLPAAATDEVVLVETLRCTVTKTKTHVLVPPARSFTALSTKGYHNKTLSNYCESTKHFINAIVRILCCCH